ncbi:Serpin B9 [Fukomys damarensis]|uniref:Serpin B9 n=1 Tax=Fukomys damarensis TaxID=885580 RepID=A0A091DRP6_FUKDA|nr:Serpin B9 [Fukomys damarensis]
MNFVLLLLFAVLGSPHSELEVNQLSPKKSCIQGQSHQPDEVCGASLGIHSPVQAQEREPGMSAAAEVPSGREGAGDQGPRGLSLLKLLGQDDPAGNVFFSPVSVSSTMAMILLGAKGDTAAQIAQALALNPKEDIHGSFQSLLTEVNRPGAPYSFSIANGLFGEESCKILPSFTESCLKVYHAEVDQLPFAEAPEKSRKHINSWVSKKTEDKIQELLAEDSIGRGTRLVLVNAVYFKGRWDKKFAVSSTRTVPFTVNQKEKKPVQMMYQEATFPLAQVREVQAQVLELSYNGHELSMIILLPDKGVDLSTKEKKPVQMMYREATFPLAQVREVQAQVLELSYNGHELSMIILLPDKGVDLSTKEKKPVQMMYREATFPLAQVREVRAQVLELSYNGHELSMVILLPDKGVDLSTLEDTLTFEKFQTWTSAERMKRTEVEVFLPRFKLQEDYDMCSVLKRLGMEHAFEEGCADLSGMVADSNLSLSKFVHKSLEDTLTFEKFQTWTSAERMKRTEVEVFLPRFKLQEDYDMCSVLKRLGMEHAFEEGCADLSGMVADSNLSLSKFVHKSVVEINEEGTEATAASACMAVPCCASESRSVFRADHPFLFFIRHNKTNSLLFCGRFSSP